ncbi:hypothetical protein ACTXQV_82045, partial [Klebsiella pneumoniae]
LWFWENGVSGIFNLGTGRAESFQAVAAFEQFRAFAIIQLGIEGRSRRAATTGLNCIIRRHGSMANGSC